MVVALSKPLLGQLDMWTISLFVEIVGHRHGKVLRIEHPSNRVCQNIWKGLFKALVANDHVEAGAVCRAGDKAYCGRNCQIAQKECICLHHRTCPQVWLAQPITFGDSTLLSGLKPPRAHLKR